MLTLVPGLQRLRKAQRKLSVAPLTRDLFLWLGHLSVTKSGVSVWYTETQGSKASVPARAVTQPSVSSAVFCCRSSHRPARVKRATYTDAVFQ